MSILSKRNVLAVAFITVVSTALLALPELRSGVVGWVLTLGMVVGWLVLILWAVRTTGRDAEKELQKAGWDTLSSKRQLAYGVLLILVVIAVFVVPKLVGLPFLTPLLLLPAYAITARIIVKRMRKPSK